MALIVPDNLYVIHCNPVNRHEKRAAQKEYEKIQYHVLPLVLTYLETENKTDELRLLARDEYIKRCKLANKGNTFVTADPFFFGRHFPTTEKIKQIIKPRRQASYAAIVISAIILLMILALIVSHLTK